MIPAFVLAVGIVATGVVADPLGQFREAMRLANAQVTSYEIRVSSPLGLSGIIDVDNTGPNKRFHMRMNGPLPVEMFGIGGRLYQKMGSTPWTRQTVPDAAERANLMHMLDGAVHFTLEPDVVEGGTTYGAMTIDVDLSQAAGSPMTLPPTTLACTYDKKSLLMHACKNGLVGMSYVYNIPLTIELPPEAAAAIEQSPRVLPSPMP